MPLKKGKAGMLSVQALVARVFCFHLTETLPDSRYLQNGQISALNIKISGEQLHLVCTARVKDKEETV